MTFWRVVLVAILSLRAYATYVRFFVGLGASTHLNDAFAWGLWIGLLFDLGQPWDIWHPLVMWNHHPFMFEVAWCVMIYTSVLALEFCPVVLERFKLHRPLRHR